MIKITDFFKTEEPKELVDTPISTKTKEPEKVKVGEKEYTQDELSQVVGLGETARKFEQEWNRPIEKFYPDYTQKSQRLAELERAEAERTKAELDRKAQEGNLSLEETRALAIEEAKKLGLMTQDNFQSEVNKAVTNALVAKQLVDDTSAVIAEAQEKGQPQVTIDKLLGYMEENGIRNPEKAYKLMFEPEIDKWKEEQLNTIKPTPMTTQEGSTAGSKIPPAPPAVTRDNLTQAIQESLTRSRGM